MTAFRLRPPARRGATPPAPRARAEGGLLEPYWFLGGRPLREAELRAYILRQHRRGRQLGEILDDPYVRRFGSVMPWRALVRPDTISALQADVRAAIEAARPEQAA